MGTSAAGHEFTACGWRKYKAAPARVRAPHLAKGGGHHNPPCRQKVAASLAPGSRGLPLHSLSAAVLVGARSLLSVFLSIHVGVLMDRFGTRRVSLFFVWMAMALAPRWSGCGRP